MGRAGRIGRAAAARVAMERAALEVAGRGSDGGGDEDDRGDGGGRDDGGG